MFFIVVVEPKRFSGRLTDATYDYTTVKVQREFSLKTLVSGPYTSNPIRRPFLKDDSLLLMSTDCPKSDAHEIQSTNVSNVSFLNVKKGIFLSNKLTLNS